MSLKRAETERFTAYGPEIGAEKGHFISSCKRPLGPK